VSLSTETLYLLAGVRDCGYKPERDDNWAAADEVARTQAGALILGHAPPAHGDAQRIGAKLAALERRGLLESRDEGWGKLWRLAPRVRGLGLEVGA
jgi:hypothetical protein